MRSAHHVLIIGLGLSLFLVAGTALAHTNLPETTTLLKADPDGPVDPRTRVELFGRVEAPRQACVDGTVVALIEKGEGVIDTDTLGGSGKFSFFVRVTETTRFRVKYFGETINSVHPHNHVCEVSSAVVKVRVPD